MLLKQNRVWPRKTKLKIGQLLYICEQAFGNFKCNIYRLGKWKPSLQSAIHRIYANFWQNKFHGSPKNPQNPQNLQPLKKGTLQYQSLFYLDIFNIFNSYLLHRLSFYSIHSGLLAIQLPQTNYPVICYVLNFLVEGTEIIFFYFGAHDQTCIIPLIVDPVNLCLISPYTEGCAWECLSYLISRIRDFFGAGVPKDCSNPCPNVPHTLLTIPGLPPSVLSLVATSLLILLYSYSYIARQLNFFGFNLIISISFKKACRLKLSRLYSSMGICSQLNSINMNKCIMVCIVASQLQLLIINILV